MTGEKGLKLLRPDGRLVAYGFANLASGQRRRPARLLSQVAGHELPVSWHAIVPFTFQIQVSHQIQR
jgi:hypothetical protein